MSRISKRKLPSEAKMRAVAMALQREAAASEEPRSGPVVLTRATTASGAGLIRFRFVRMAEQYRAGSRTTGARRRNGRKRR